MSRSLLRKFASLSFKTPSPSIFMSPQLSLSSQSHLPFSSSTQPPQSETSSSATSSNDDLPADVSTEELKQRIDRYFQGDAEAIPSIFEAILARKLSGKHEDTDDELMEEFRSKTPHEEEGIQFELDEDDEDDELSSSDEELSD